MARGTLKWQEGELFLISFIILFLELALIRWLSTEIRFFAYVNNFVLLACFLGIGFGCYYAKVTPNLAITLVGIVALIILGTNQSSSACSTMKISGLLPDPGAFSCKARRVCWRHSLSSP